VPHAVLFVVVSLTDTRPTAIYTLSLHDALPICYRHRKTGAYGADGRPQDSGLGRSVFGHTGSICDGTWAGGACLCPWDSGQRQRSEEHTSELQSRFDLVCRLLLEKKKKTTR